jgi:hypothetical protein
MIALIKRYLLNILIWLDIGVNVIILAGSPHQTISGRVGGLNDAGDTTGVLAEKAIDSVFGVGHCKSSETPDMGETLSGHGTRWLMIFGVLAFLALLAFVWAFFEGVVVLDFGAWK